MSDDARKLEELRGELEAGKLPEAVAGAAGPVRRRRRSRRRRRPAGSWTRWAG